MGYRGGGWGIGGWGVKGGFFRKKLNFAEKRTNYTKNINSAKNYYFQKNIIFVKSQNPSLKVDLVKSRFVKSRSR